MQMIMTVMMIFMKIIMYPLPMMIIMVMVIMKIIVIIFQWDVGVKKSNHTFRSCLHSNIETDFF